MVVSRKSKMRKNSKTRGKKYSKRTYRKNFVNRKTKVMQKGGVKPYNSQGNQGGYKRNTSPGSIRKVASQGASPGASPGANPGTSPGSIKKAPPSFVRASPGATSPFAIRNEIYGVRPVNPESHYNTPSGARVFKVESGASYVVPDKVRASSAPALYALKYAEGTLPSPTITRRSGPGSNKRFTEVKANEIVNNGTKLYSGLIGKKNPNQVVVETDGVALFGTNPNPNINQIKFLPGGVAYASVEDVLGAPPGRPDRPKPQHLQNALKIVSQVVQSQEALPVRPPKPDYLRYQQ